MSASETFLLNEKVGHKWPEVKNVTPTLCLFLLRPVLLSGGESRKEKRGEKKTDTDLMKKKVFEWHSWRGNKSAVEYVGGNVWIGKNTWRQVSISFDAVVFPMSPRDDWECQTKGTEIRTLFDAGPNHQQLRTSSCNNRWQTMQKMPPKLLLLNTARTALLLHSNF